MSIYCEKCRTRIATGNRCTTCGHINPGGGASSEMPMAPPPQMPAPGQPVYSPGVVMQAAGPFQKSIGGAVTLLVFSAIGVLSPFLPFVSDDFDSVNGWDSREIFDAYDEFSASPILILLGCLAALIFSIVIIANQNQGKPTNKSAAGVTVLIAGVVALGSGGMAYSSWDSILQYEGYVASQGIGLWLSVVCGLAIMIMGIVALASPKFTQGSQ